jgi:hypothetical protein
MHFVCPQTRATGHDLACAGAALDAEIEASKTTMKAARRTKPFFGSDARRIERRLLERLYSHLTAPASRSPGSLSAISQAVDGRGRWDSHGDRPTSTCFAHPFVARARGVSADECRQGFVHGQERSGLEARSSVPSRASDSRVLDRPTRDGYMSRQREWPPVRPLQHLVGLLAAPKRWATSNR